MAKFQAKKAVREKVFVKIALMGPSGGGKTYSGLRLCEGMAEEIEKTTGRPARILMANSESFRGKYYANEFNYDFIDLEPPYTPELYIDAINYALEEGYDLLLLDSTSPEWEGKGGCLELHAKAGGTYQSWSKVTPRHNNFINAIAESPIHIVATMKGKDQYETVKDEKTNRMTVQKLGVGGVQRQGFEYDFTCTFLLDQKTNTAEAQKDNTHIFESEGPVQLTQEHGKKIIQWANSGNGYTPSARKNEDVAAENAGDDLTVVKKEIVTYCQKLGGTKNAELMKVLKEYTPTGNPNAIKNIEEANKCLTEIKAVKPLA